MEAPGLRGSKNGEKVYRRPTRGAPSLNGVAVNSMGGK